MIDYFITTYNDGNGKHLYYFPGLDDSGKRLTKMSFMTSPGDYRYTKQSDGAIDYLMLESPSQIVCRVTNVTTQEHKDITIKL